MGFEPGIVIGEELTNAKLVEVFGCGNMGGMRRSHATNTLVLISDYTKGLYKDQWIDGVLHYTGMGKLGDMDINFAQNKTLAQSGSNNVDVHLFEVIEKAIYTYRGIVKLVGKPYESTQPDDEGNERKVWMFPIKPVVDIEEAVPEEELPKLSNRQLIKRVKMSEVEKSPRATEVTVYHRNKYLKEIVKRIADGKCQFCGMDAPFRDKSGVPYLEEHHVKKLANGGTDTIDNVVAICPNCHRRIHVLEHESDTLVLVDIAKTNKDMYERLLSINI